MCAIFGSKELDKLLELADLNAYRGQHSHSLSVYNTRTKELVTKRKCLGAFSLDGLETERGMFYVAHIQAPTTAASAIESIHPSVRRVGEDLLWHNGIIKEGCIKSLKETYQSDLEWDTALIHEAISHGYRQLDNVDGTYSCLQYDEGEIFIFRNEISPMFIDDQLNISSTKFQGSSPTEPNKAFMIDFTENELLEVASFSTKENPYYFGNI